jgi:uncharacterized membrane protein YfcA
VENETRLLSYGAWLLAAGIGSGFAGGLFGIGGGVLRIPIFLYLFPAFGMDPAVVMHTAAGTSLALAVPTGLRSALSQRRAGHLDIAFLRSWLPPLVVGVLIGLLAMRSLSGTILAGVFAFAMLGVALQLIALPPSVRLADAVPGHPVRDCLAAGIGGVSVMIGVSGGAFSTPLLMLLGVPVHGALAISSASAAAIAALGSVGSVLNGLHLAGRPPWSLGYVDVVAVAVMLPAILLAAPLGVKLGSRLGERPLRRLFGVFLFGIAADMLRGVLG